ncbi:MAG: 2-C-methyl-D-erythritol 2,4-cyclodiphosphate synthase [Verrucomicrobia bacterium]|nr:2-C-methyl-D-erythritol 2,4-cyclodiphosphate synthase [Verrucomicrobiota bacterium]
MTPFPSFKVGLGQDSHRFLPPESSKPCIIGGLIFDDTPGLAADSDGDVVFHAICNAITSISGVPILGGVAIELCHKNGITDSQVYLERALESLGKWKIEHVALSIEGKRPRLEPRNQEMRQKVADVLKISLSQVGLTATSGDGLTDFGCGEGLQCFCILTVRD